MHKQYQKNRKKIISSANKRPLWVISSQLDTFCLLSHLALKQGIPANFIFFYSRPHQKLLKSLKRLYPNAQILNLSKARTLGQILAFLEGIQ